MNNKAWIWWNNGSVRQASDTGNLGVVGSFSYMGGDRKDMMIGISAAVSNTGGPHDADLLVYGPIGVVGVDISAIGGGNTTTIGDIG